ncbi:MAG: hypothetical protein QXI59_01450 [Candidatus Bathyarchaeia archaeon]
MKIRTSTLNITQNQALQAFKRREKRSKPLLNMELLYAPFWLMTYKYHTVGESQQGQAKKSQRILKYLTQKKRPAQTIESRVVLVADAVLGQIAFLKGEDASGMVDVEVDVKEEDIIGVAIPINRVVGKAESELKKRLLSIYMWRTKNFSLQLESSQIFYVPFWVGYYKVGQEERIQIEVMNALSGEVGDSWHRGIIETGILRMYQKPGGTCQSNL